MPEGVDLALLVRNLPIEGRKLHLLIGGRGIRKLDIAPAVEIEIVLIVDVFQYLHARSRKRAVI